MCCLLSISILICTLFPFCEPIIARDTEMDVILIPILPFPISDGVVVIEECLFHLLILSLAAVGFTTRNMIVLMAWTLLNAQQIVSSTHAGFPTRGHSVTLLKCGDSWNINVNQLFALVQQEPGCTSVPWVMPGSLTRVQATSVLCTGCFSADWDKNYSLTVFSVGMPFSKDIWRLKEK